MITKGDGSKIVTRGTYPGDDDLPNVEPLALTFDETGQLIQMVRARIENLRAFKRPHDDLTALVNKLLVWLDQVAP